MLLTAEAAQAQINISGKVFGGARQANVGGHTYVNISAQKHDVIINAVYGGNDIAGTIGSSTKPSGVDDGNHIDGLGSYNSFVRTNKEAMGKHLFIGQLFGGGYGNYTYDNPDNGKFDVTVPNMKVWDENESNFKTQSITFQAVFKPELAKERDGDGEYPDLHQRQQHRAHNQYQGQGDEGWFQQSFGTADHRAPAGYGHQHRVFQ